MIAEKFRTLFLVVVSSILITGCTSYKVRPYQPSYHGSELLEDLAVTEIAVGAFVSNSLTENSIRCWKSGNFNIIRLPEGDTFSSYFQKALISELRKADVYAEDGQVVLSGKILNIDLNYIKSGFPRTTHSIEWNISVIIYSSNGHSISITNTSRTGGGPRGCKSAAGILPRAIKSNILKLIKHRDFKQLVS